MSNLSEIPNEMPPRNARQTPPTIAERISNALPYAVFLGLVYLMFGGSAKKHAEFAHSKITTRTLPPPPPRQPSTLRLPLCSLPSSSPASSDEQGCPIAEQCGGAFYANYLADELIQLDVNSHERPPEGGWREGVDEDDRGGGRGGEDSERRPLPPVATAADCCQACRDNPQCNVW